MNPSKAASKRLTMRTWFTRVRGLLPEDDWLVVGWVVATKILLLVFGVRSYKMLEDKPVPSGIGFLEIWNRWDALHFQRLAQLGYSAADTLKAWFYPLYPWCVRLVAYVIGNFVVSAFVVSGIVSIVAAVLLRRIVRLD